MKRTRAAALAFAMACGAVGLAGPAAAETTYMSLAFAPTNRIVGEGTSTVSAEDAQGQAVASCQSRGGSDCRWATWNTAPGCVALVAASDGDRWAGGFGSTTD